MFSDKAFFNHGRETAFITLLQTLRELKGNLGISEKDFRDSWYKNMEEAGSIIADGWYTPPPNGMAVLAGDTAAPSRISFESLRKEKYWPSDRIINWDSDLFYVYCSPFDAQAGIIGDLALTLYFGHDKEIRRHFQRTYLATREVLESLPGQHDSGDLFRVSQEIFAKHRLKNCVVSYTDQVTLDLGHTLPQVDLGGPDANLILTSEQKDSVRTARKFINSESAWLFTDGLQFTVEPQLTSLDDPELPQITYHYVVQYLNGFNVCTDVDILLHNYGLT